MNCRAPEKPSSAKSDSDARKASEDLGRLFPTVALFFAAGNGFLLQETRPPVTCPTVADGRIIAQSRIARLRGCLGRRRLGLA